MKLLSEFDEEDFAKKLDTGSELLALKLIPLALAGGVLMFGGVVAGLFFMNVDKDVTVRSGETLLSLLSIVHALLFVTSLAVGMVLSKSRLSPAHIESVLGKTMHMYRGPDIDDAPSKFVALFRQAMLMRLALLEAAAIFGIIICLIGTMDGSIREQPALWLNLLSAVCMILYVVLTLPSKERLMSLLRQKKELARLGRI